MVQQHLTLWNVPKQHQFCPKIDGKVLNFLPMEAQIRCGLTEMMRTQEQA
jgi:hypothetical protein